MGNFIFGAIFVVCVAYIVFMVVAPKKLRKLIEDFLDDTFIIDNK